MRAVRGRGMRAVRDILVEARALYAANPSHAPLGHRNAPGTYCIVTAVYAAAPHVPLPAAPHMPLHIARAALAAFTSSADHIARAALAALTSSADHKLGLVTFNAEHSTGEVLRVFDKAIEQA